MQTCRESLNSAGIVRATIYLLRSTLAFRFVKWTFMWKFFKHNLALVISLNYAV